VIRRAFLQALVLGAIALVPAAISGALQLKKEEPLQAGEIRSATARQWGEKALFVDARTRARFDAGHIPGALLLNEEEWDDLFPKLADAWDPDKAVVVYCDGGNCDASHRVAKRLEEALSVETVFVLKGGWPAWQRK
jgi:rhodanese-related sulfurtransferase